MPLTLEYLKEQVRYEEDTGLFFWLVRKRGRQTDKPVGSRTGVHGTNRITIDGVSYSASKLAWFYMTGVWIEYIGYRDFNPINLKWENLEELNEVEQSVRIKVQSPNSNGIRAIAKNYSTGRWFLQNWNHGKVVKGPYFDTPLEALQEWKTQNRVIK
jgi:hypothetical protein